MHLLSLPIFVNFGLIIFHQRRNTLLSNLEPVCFSQSCQTALILKSYTRSWLSNLSWNKWSLDNLWTCTCRWRRRALSAQVSAWWILYRSRELHRLLAGCSWWAGCGCSPALFGHLGLCLRRILKWEHFADKLQTCMCWHSSMGIESPLCPGAHLHIWFAASIGNSRSSSCLAIQTLLLAPCSSYTNSLAAHLQ